METVKEIGKTYQCWYNGELREAVVTGYKHRWAWVTVRLEGTEDEVTVRGDHVRWNNDAPFRLQHTYKKPGRKKKYIEEKPDRKGIGRAVLCRSQSAADKKKAEAVRRSLTRIKNNLCNVGAFSVKSRLTFLAKAGDIYASILRHALEVETVNLSMMNSSISMQTFSVFQFQRNRALETLIHLCTKNNTHCGIYPKDKTVCCIRLSGGSIVGFPAKLWGVKTDGLPSFEHEWDEKITWNLRRLEDEIYSSYNNILW